MNIKYEANGKKYETKYCTWASNELAELENWNWKGQNIRVATEGTSARKLGSNKKYYTLSNPRLERNLSKGLAEIRLVLQLNSEQNPDVAQKLSIPLVGSATQPPQEIQVVEDQLGKNKDMVALKEFWESKEFTSLKTLQVKAHTSMTTVECKIEKPLAFNKQLTTVTKGKISINPQIPSLDLKGVKLEHEYNTFEKTHQFYFAVKDANNAVVKTAKYNSKTFYLLVDEKF